MNYNYDIREGYKADMAVTTLDNGEKLAAILLSAKNEYKYSPAKVSVSYGTIIIPKDCSFIKPPSWDELLNFKVESAMATNSAVLNLCMYMDILSTIHGSILVAIEKYNCKYMRLCYGGDLYTIVTERHNKENLLRDLNNMLKEKLADKDIVIIVRTSHIERADSELYELQKNNELDPRLVVVAETQTYDDMPLFIKDRVRYYWYDSAPDDAVEDIKSIPIKDDGTGFFNREVAIRIPRGARKLFDS